MSSSGDGINSWKRSKTRNERLRDASQSGDLTELKTLIRENININDDDTYGLAALHLACQSNHIEVIRELLQHEADPNLKDKYGVTPLILSAQRCSYDAVSLLLQHKAHVNAQSQFGHTALIKCVSTPTLHSKIITQLLLSHKAKTELTDTDSHLTALHYATRANNIACVTVLVQDGGANIDAKDKDGNTALHLAACEQNWSILQELVALGADTSLLNNAGTALTDVYVQNDQQLDAKQYRRLIEEAITAGQAVQKKRVEMKRLNELKRADAQVAAERRRAGLADIKKTVMPTVKRVDVSSLLTDDVSEEQKEVAEPDPVPA